MVFHGVKLLVVAGGGSEEWSHDGSGFVVLPAMAELSNGLCAKKNT